MKRQKVNKKFLGLVAVLIVALVSAYYTGWKRPALSKPEALIKDALAPLQSGVTTIVKSGESLVGGIVNYRQIQRENAELKEQVEELAFQVNLLEEYRLESARLRGLLRFEVDLIEDYEMLSAKVIARNPSNWYQTLTVSRGRAEGVEKDMAVITIQGVVGRILSVAEHSAEVLLILDQEGAVGGMIQSTRFPGIVEGTADESNLLQMIHIPHDSPVRENQTVITSGLGGIFPKGLRIGFITEINSEPNGLMKKALIRPFVDYDRLEEVLIISGVKGGE